MSATRDENTSVADVGNETAGQDVEPDPEARDSELAKAEVAVQVGFQLGTKHNNGIKTKCTTDR